MKSSRKTRVLVIDDSALVRAMLSKILAQDNALEVVGTAEDAFHAREMIKQLKPDVLTLDIEMPKMDGISFLRNLMRLRPTPVVMISTLTSKGANVTLEALQLGAVDFVTKPTVNAGNGLMQHAAEICEKVRVAATAQISAMVDSRTNAGVLKLPPTVLSTSEQIIAIGASAGGTEALKVVLARMPARAPGIVVSLHIPPVFSQSFAKSLDNVCEVSVCEARDGEIIRPGNVYIAPGDRHLEICAYRRGFRCTLSTAPLVMRHRPSVDVLFRSVAQCAGERSIAAILTGMGRDGSEAIGEIKAAGGATIAQDEKTSLVWGMPGVAVSLGSVQEVLPLQDIAPRLLHLASMPLDERIAS